MNRWTQLGALFTVASLAACGGDGADGGAADTTKSSKQLKDLTADEVQVECEALAQQIKLSKEDTCEFAGLISTTFGQVCDTVKTQCMAASESSSGQGQAEASCLPPTEQRAGCTATLDEYRFCLIAQTEVIRGLTCQSDLSTLDTPPHDCDAVVQKCPRLLSADSNAGQGGSQTP